MRYSVFSVNDHYPGLPRTVPELYRQVMRQCELGEELAKVKASSDEGKYDEGARLFEKITTDDKYVEFLTLPAYQQID